MRWPWTRHPTEDEPSSSEELKQLSNETRRLAADLLRLSITIREQEGLPR